MLHKLSFDTKYSMAISYWQVQEYLYGNIFSFGEQVWAEYHILTVRRGP